MTTGEAAPQFSLPDTEGVTHALGASPTAVVFTCNHCPYALAWHDRLLDVARDYEGRARVLHGQLQRREPLPARLLRGHARAGGGRRRLAGALPARREPGGRAGLRGADHARRLPASTPTGCCATGAPRTPTTRTRGGRALAARRARRGAGRPRARPGRDRAGGLQREVVAVALGLTASLAWGTADFLGGLKSRTLNVLAVLVASQTVALILLAAATGIRGDGPPAAGGLALAALAGAGGVLGLAAFYRGLAIGAMAVVAPIGGLGAVLPGGGGRGHGRAPRRPGGGGDRAGAGGRGAVLAGGGRGRQPGGRRRGPGPAGGAGLRHLPHRHGRRR